MQEYASRSFGSDGVSAMRHFQSSRKCPPFWRPGFWNVGTRYFLSFDSSVTSTHHGQRHVTTGGDSPACREQWYCEASFLSSRCRMKINLSERERERAVIDEECSAPCRISLASAHRVRFSNRHLRVIINTRDIYIFLSLEMLQAKGVSLE